MQKSSLHLVLDSIEELPTLPAVMVQLQQCIDAQRTTMKTIGNIIHNDQSLSAKVLRLVNSAYYGLHTEVKSIERAIVVLGLNTVKNIALGVSVIDTFEHARANQFRTDYFWIHALETAVYAEHIARMKELAHPEDYFIAGLLHDLGIIFESQYMTESFFEAIDSLDDFQGNFPAAETVSIGANHAELGHYLAARWELPPVITIPLRWHHHAVSSDDCPPDHQQMVEAVRIGDTYSRMRGLGTFIEKWTEPLDILDKNLFGLNSDDLKQAFEPDKEHVNAIAIEWGIV